MGTDSIRPIQARYNWPFWKDYAGQTCKWFWFESWIESESNDFRLNHESNRITFFVISWIIRWIDSFFGKPDWIMNWIESIPKRCRVKSIVQTRILWRVTLVHTAIKPNPDYYRYIGIFHIWDTVYRLLGSAENLLQHGAYGSTFRAFQKSVFQIIILKTALWNYMKTWAQLCFVI